MLGVLAGGGGTLLIASTDDDPRDAYIEPRSSSSSSIRSNLLAMEIMLELCTNDLKVGGELFV